MESERLNMNKLAKRLKNRLLDGKIPSIDELSNLIGLSEDKTKDLIVKLIDEMKTKNGPLIGEYVKALNLITSNYRSKVNMIFDTSIKKQIEQKICLAFHLIKLIEINEDVIDKIEEQIESVDKLLSVRYDLKEREQRYQKYQNLHLSLHQHSKLVDEVREQISVLNEKLRANYIKIGENKLETENDKKRNLKHHQRIREIEKKIEELHKRVEESKSNYQKEKEKARVGTFGISN